MRGLLQSGGTGTNVVPLGRARVELFEATELAARKVAETVTNLDGTFAVYPASTTSPGIFYATADLGAGYTLMAMLGGTLPDEVTVNELTTVSAVWCGAQFLEGRAFRGRTFGLRVAAAMNANVVDVARGSSSTVLTSPPNADETNALRLTRALANLVASCFRGGQAARDAFFALAAVPGQPPPANTIAALHDIARAPANNAASLYAQSKSVEQVYQPALMRAPDAWTLAVKVNDSGDVAHPFGGPANIAFDKHGRAWITNNVVQGTAYSTEWSIVLEPDGRPAPFSPITGGGLLGPGYGIDIGPDDRVWVGNFGWGGRDPKPAGSVSVFDLDGQPRSPEIGFQNKTAKVQGTVVDRHGNVWMASYGNHAVVVYLNGDPETAVVFDDGGNTAFSPFDIDFLSDGTAWVSSTSSDAATSSIVHLRLHGQTLQLLDTIIAGKTNKGIVVDSKDNVWVASGGDSQVYGFDAAGKPLGAFSGGGMSGPWGISVDGADNLWVANFGPLAPGDFTGRLTQLSPSGAALSPDSGYTLPHSGEQVRLRSGIPLYGPDGPPCFIPLMRLTSATADAAGNVWACNNWKPGFVGDLLGNPGGDGIVIFIGLAAPRA